MLCNGDDRLNIHIHLIEKLYSFLCLFSDRNLKLYENHVRRIGKLRANLKRTSDLYRYMPYPDLLKEKLKSFNHRLKIRFNFVSDNGVRYGLWTFIQTFNRQIYL